MQKVWELFITMSQSSYLSVFFLWQPKDSFHPSIGLKQTWTRQLPTCVQKACVDVKEDTSTCLHQRARCLERLRKRVLVKTLVVLVMRKSFLLNLSYQHLSQRMRDRPQEKKCHGLRPKSDCSHIARAVAADWHRTLRGTCLAHSPPAA